MLSRTTTICSYCESDLNGWAATLREASAANAPQVWTCPECDAVLGVSAGQPQ